MSSIKTDELGQLHQYGVYTPARIISLDGDISEETAVQFIKNIRLMDHMTEKEITVLLNTGGGDVHQGLAIYDAIKECRSKVITHAVGPCWSMGACILQAGDYRVISNYATVMIHAGALSPEDDHPVIVDRWIKEYHRIGDIYDDIILERIREKKPRFKKEKLKDLMVFDTIYNAKSVIEMGLADEVAEHKG